MWLEELVTPPKAGGGVSEQWSPRTLSLVVFPQSSQGCHSSFLGPAFDTSSAAASTDPSSLPLQVWNSPCWHLHSCDSWQMLCIPGCSAGFGSPLWLQALGKLKRRRKRGPTAAKTLQGRGDNCQENWRGFVPAGPQPAALWLGPAGNLSRAGGHRGGRLRGCSKPSEARSHVQKRYPPSGDHLHLSGRSHSRKQTWVSSINVFCFKYQFTFNSLGLFCQFVSPPPSIAVQNLH